MEMVKERVRTGQSIKDFVALSGKKRNSSVLYSKLSQLTDNKIMTDLLMKYFYLLVHTNFLSDVAYDVLIARLTYKEVLVKYPEIKESYLRNIVYKEGKRVFTELGCDPYSLLDSKDVSDKDTVQLLELINDKIRMHGVRGMLGGGNILRGTGGGVFAANKELLTQLNIDFAKYAEIDEDFISHFEKDAEFVQVAKKLRMLSKSYADAVLNNIDSKLLGYFYYLLSEREEKLSEVQVSRKQQLREVWWLRDVN